MTLGAGVNLWSSIVFIVIVSSHCLHDDPWGPEEGALELRRMQPAPRGDDVGVVFVYHDGMWGGICRDSWSMIEARVVCSQLGYDYTVSHEIPEYIHPHPDFGEWFWLDAVRCEGDEWKLVHCNHSEWGFIRCPSGELAGVECGYKWYEDDGDWGSVSFKDYRVYIYVFIGLLVVGTLVYKGCKIYKREELSRENLSDAYPQSVQLQQGSEAAQTTTTANSQGASVATSDPMYQVNNTLEVTRTGDVINPPDFSNVLPRPQPPSQQTNGVLYNTQGALGIQGRGTDNNGQQLPNVVLTSLPADAVQQSGVMPMPPPTPVLYPPPAPPVYQLPGTPAPQSAANYTQNQAASDLPPPPSYDSATA